MQVAEFLPKFLKKHKIINFLILSKLQKKLIKLKFNENSYNFINLADPEPRNVFIHQVFELDFFKITESLMPENGTFFDIGANVGFCTFGLVSSRPKASFHLFEANIKLINLLNLSKRLHPNKDFFINHCCVGNTSGRSFFKVREDQSGQSHVSKTEEDVQVNNCILDNYCIAQKVSKVDFAKIDIEGFELQALKGWKRQLYNHTIRTIHIESFQKINQDMGMKQMHLFYTWSLLGTNYFSTRMMILKFLMELLNLNLSVQNKYLF